MRLKCSWSECASCCEIDMLNLDVAVSADGEISRRVTKLPGGWCVTFQRDIWEGFCSREHQNRELHRRLGYGYLD